MVAEGEVDHRSFFNNILMKLPDKFMDKI